MCAASHSRNELDLSLIDWRRADATTDQDIEQQAADDPDTAPIFTEAEILALGRRVVRQPGAVAHSLTDKTE